jgi:phosphatidate cytidylyltransferase
LTSEPSAQKSNRAGRNLPAAIAVGATLGALVVGSLFWVKDLFVVIVDVALALGVFELARAFRAKQTVVPVTPVLVGGVLMLPLAYFGSVEAAAATMALTVLAILVWRLRSGADGFVRDVTAGVFTLSYLFLMGVFVMRMLAADDGEFRIAAFILATISSDIGGYAAGVLAGRHPMAPGISPKKTWEGFVGSLVTGVLVSIVTVVYGLDGRWWVGVILGAAAVAMATLGDLFESLIKRDLGIKDMGHLLPGHGGIMDRLDSLIGVAPVAFVILYYLVPA